MSKATFYEFFNHEPSNREKRDNYIKEQIIKIYNKNYCCYGVRKMWKAFKRTTDEILKNTARCTVERLMKELEIKGAIRGKIKNHKNKTKEIDRPEDKLKRDFNSDSPNKVWVADFTYVWTKTGWAYVAFIIDVFARVIVGCKTSTTMTADFVTAALEKAISFRKNAGQKLDNLIHHSDAGSQYMSLMFSQKLVEHNIVPSVGTVGDSYDNALAENINGTYKTELIKTRTWKDWKEVEYETNKYVKWFNEERFTEFNDWKSPIETENEYFSTQKT